MSDVYEKVVLLARRYKSFAAELYVSRLAKSCGLARETLTVASLPALCRAARAEWSDPDDAAKLKLFLLEMQELHVALRDEPGVPRVETR
jgi:hypothetical protein